MTCRTILITLLFTANDVPFLDIKSNLCVSLYNQLLEQGLPEPKWLEELGVLTNLNSEL